MSVPGRDRPTARTPAPRVSVILPTRNRADLLPRATSSVLGQTFQELELIVVDDASTDHTREVLAGLAEADPRVRTVHLPEPGGAAAARNRGIEQARGELVAFLDDDDEWLPSKTELQVAVLERTGPEVGAVYSPYYHVRTAGEERLLGMVDVSGGRARRALFQSNFITMPSLMVRRGVVDAVGGLDERLPRLQDWDLWVRLAAVTELAFVPEPLVRIHSTPGSITTQREPLVEACRLLAAKVAAREDVSPAERADWCYALGHVLMIGGAPAEGRKLLRRSVHLRPWPPRRLAMVALASWVPGLHGAVSGVHRRVIER